MAFPYPLENYTRSFNAFWKKLKQQIKPRISQLHRDMTVNISGLHFHPGGLLCMLFYAIKIILSLCGLFCCCCCYMGL